MSYPGPYRPRTSTRSRPAGRTIYSRRRRRPRWGAIALVVLTPLILLFAAFKSCSGGATTTTVDLTGYVDRARVLVQRSNEVGARFQTMIREVGTFTRTDLNDALDEMRTASLVVYQDAITELIEVPVPARAPHGHLLTALRARIDGLGDVKPALLGAALGDAEGAEAAAIATFKNSLTALLLADVAYRYFSEDISAELARARQRSEVPASSYVRDTDLAKPETQDAVVRAIRSSDKLKATVDVRVAGVMTIPDAVGSADDNGVFSLPPSTAFELQVQVVNLGNSPARNITVRVELESQGATDAQVDTAPIDIINPGDTKATVVRKLSPARGDLDNRITVSLETAGDVDPTNNGLTFVFRMAK